MGGRRNKSSRMAYTFDSAADFKDFTKTHDIALVSKDGLMKRGVRSLSDATLVAVGDYLLLTTPFDTIDENVTNLQAYRKNDANGQERATTLAIASSEQARMEFGPLTLVCKGESIVFSNKDDGGDVLEADGIIANKEFVILNSVKHSPKKEDVVSLVSAKKVLEKILARPSGYLSEPEGALKEMKGIKKVKPFLSGYDFPPEVLKTCRKHRVHAIRPNGLDYGLASRGLHILARVGLSLLRK